MTDYVVVIPARYASQRLPGKPLREIAGKPMIQHVYERGLESAASEVVIATDDERIRAAAEAFGASVCLTSAEHSSGTERIAEVCDLLGWDDDRIVVNLQGDEPTMPAQLIDQCAGLLDDASVDIATLASPVASREDFESPNVVKVVVDEHDNALYFSRAAIPYARDPGKAAEAMRAALHHHGIYGYRAGVLRQLVRLPPSRLELSEQLEQLRALAAGMTIRIGRPLVRPGRGVDTEPDLVAVAREMAGET